MKSEGIPPEKKALIVDFIMGVRAIVTNPDESAARKAAEELVDKIDAEMAKDDA